MVKIHIKPLKGTPFDVEAELSESILVLKGKIGSVLQDAPPALQKLVFNGKVLTDDQTVEKVGMKDGDFVVAMISKPKPEADTAPPAAAPAAVAAPQIAPTPPAASAPEPAPAAPAQAAPQPNAQEETVKMLCEMGFPRDQVMVCLRAAFGNPDRAVEYLMSGIPPAVVQQQQQAQQAQQAQQQQQRRPVAASGPQAPAPTGPLAKLMANPLYRQLQMICQQNTGMLHQALAKMAMQDPSLIDLIAENQELFVELMAEQPSGAARPAVGGAPNPAAAAALIAAAQAAQGGQAQDGGNASSDPIAALIAAAQAAQQQPASMQQPGAPAAATPAPAPAAASPPVAAAQLSPADEETIGRLLTLGFPRDACVEAFLACGKDEELAASSLFEAMDED